MWRGQPVLRVRRGCGQCQGSGALVCVSARTGGAGGQANENGGEPGWG